MTKCQSCQPINFTLSSQPRYIASRTIVFLNIQIIPSHKFNSHAAGIWQFDASVCPSAILKAFLVMFDCLHVPVCVFVCLCVSMFVSVCLCMSVFVCLCLSVCDFVCLCVSLFVFKCQCLSVCVYVCFCVTVCVYVCLCVSVCVCDDS